ncbi:MAG: LCP family protein [Candidatus Magasanikbacteria bacterium]|nr:LCP family protein [Candidatus Magasanikbacteria bacterium]
MEPEPVNLLFPKLPENPKTTRRPHWLYFFAAFLGLIILALALGRLGNSNDYGTGKVLQLKRFSLLTRVKNFIFNGNNALAGQVEGRINVLILGVGGTGHDGPYLSDTNIIASFKPSTKEVALITVPRDLAVNVPGHGWRKINSASAFGEAAYPGAGGEFARQVFSAAFQVPIHYYIRVDFKALVDVVDALSGININVPRAFTDTEYPGDNFSYQTIHFDQGEQFMNGEQALVYARSRHGTNGEGSDFARSKRQEQIIMAIKDKALYAGTWLNPIRIKGILEALSNHVATNLNFEQLMYLAGFAPDIKTVSQKLVLDSSPNGFLINTTGEDGAFILSPKSGNFNEINSAILNIFNLAYASSTAPNIGIAFETGKLPTTSTTGIGLEVQNGTWRGGLAARVGEKLAQNGFKIIRVGNSLKRPIDRSAIYVLNTKVPATEISKLSKYLAAPFGTTLPESLAENFDNASTTENEQGMKYNPSTDILIVLGADFKE